MVDLQSEILNLRSQICNYRSMHQVVLQASDSDRGFHKHRQLLFHIPRHIFESTAFGFLHKLPHKKVGDNSE